MYTSKAALRLAVLAVLASTGLTACNAQKKAPSSTQQKLASLKELHDSGILSDDEYQQKVAALQPSTATHTAAAGKPGSPTVPHTLNDPAWGISWGTIKLPAGWGFNGTVVHGDNCMMTGDNPMWTAESPDKNFGITILPVLKAGWVSDQQTLAQFQHAGCPILHSTRAADYLTQVVLPHLHPNFRVVGTAPEPMLEPMVNQFRQMNAQAPSMQTQFMQSRDTHDTARVVITYQEGGATHVEMASAELSCNSVHMSSPGGYTPPSDYTDCTSYQTIIIHAPDDGTPITSLATADFSKSTDKPFFTIQQNPAWQEHFQEVSAQKSQQIISQGQANLKANQDKINRTQNSTGGAHDPNESVADYSRRIHNNVRQGQLRANEQVTGGVVANMGDYNIYTNNSTGQQYQLSNQYNNTYVNQNGTAALQTNSANSPGVDWTALTPKY